MKIVFKNESTNFELENHTIREIDAWSEEHEKVKERPHFQALLKDKRKNKRNNAELLLTYTDNNGNFIGLDTMLLYNNTDKSSLAISMPINIPDNTETAEITITEGKSTPNFSVLEILAYATIIIVVAFGINYFAE